MKSALFVGAVAVALLSSGIGRAEEGKKIEDNSFLIEEAYNQEAGVIQHIQTFQYMKDQKSWDYSFTDEWPVGSQDHQLSVTVPISHTPSPVSPTGLGDVLLNYRYQAVDKNGIALAPRLTLMTPSGDYKKGFGSGGFGVQANLPLSVELSPNFVNHWNLGASFIPKAKDPTGAVSSSTVGFNYGTSVVYLFSQNLNFLVEFFGTSEEGYNPASASPLLTRSESFVVNPGVRGAINFQSGLQIVPGLSFPIGVGPSSGNVGALMYLSIEHGI